MSRVNSDPVKNLVDLLLWATMLLYDAGCKGQVATILERMDALYSGDSPTDTFVRVRVLDQRILISQKEHRFDEAISLSAHGLTVTNDRDEYHYYWSQVLATCLVERGDREAAIRIVYEALLAALKRKMPDSVRAGLISFLENEQPWPRREAAAIRLTIAQERHSHKQSQPRRRRRKRRNHG